MIIVFLLYMHIYSKFDKLDILINNAGIYVPTFSKSEQGLDIQIGTNVIGPQLLTTLLLPLLVKSTDARILFLSSFRNDDVKLPYFNKSITDIGGEHLTTTTNAEYCLTKLYNKFQVVELHRRLLAAAITNITITANNPGLVASDIVNKSVAIPQCLLPFLKCLFNTFSLAIQPDKVRSTIYIIHRMCTIYRISYIIYISYIRAIYHKYYIF